MKCPHCNTEININTHGGDINTNISVSDALPLDSRLRHRLEAIRDVQVRHREAHKHDVPPTPGDNPRMDHIISAISEMQIGLNHARDALLETA